MIRASVVLLFFLLYVPAASCVAWGLTLLLGSPSPIYRVGRFAIRVGLFLSGTRVVVEGAAPTDGNTVFMPNHASNLDAPVLFHALPSDFKALVKKELFKVPFLGTTLRLAGFVAVDRSARERSKEAVSRAVEALKRGQTFLIFPEGTRTRTGELGAFKKGAFIAAQEAGSRIVPIAVQGTAALLPRGGLRIRPGRVSVRILDPVDTGGYNLEDLDRLMAEVRGRIETALMS